MAIEIGRMLVDYDWTEEPNKPDSFGELIAGKRGRIFACVNYPGGKAPFPVVIHCHGVPGNEKMAEFPLILRHIGFCTISFHYSGSWGSDGEFSVLNSMEDVDTVLNYVLHNEKGIFDLNNIFVVGHSMGGLIGAYALAEHDKLRAGALIMPADFGRIYTSACESEETHKLFENLFNEFGKWLNGFSWNSFSKEAEKNIDRLTLPAYAEKLSTKPMLAIAGAMDTDLPRKEHIDILTSAIKLKNGDKLRELTVPTNHSMSDQRNTIIREIADLFSKCVV